MKKHLVLLMVVLLSISLCACGANNGNTQNEDWYNNSQNTTDPSPEEVRVPATAESDFSDGYAWVSYTDTNNTKNAILINADGKVVYNVLLPSTSTNHKFAIDTGVGFYGYTDASGNYFYVIVNSDGKEIASSENGDFTNAIACGNGQVFVYKNQSDYADQKHSYGFIDKNGNWACGPFELSNLSSIYHGVTHGRYLGCDMFLLENVSRGCAAVINSETGYAFDIREVTEYDNLHYEDNKAVAKFAGTHDDYIVVDKNGNYDYVNIKTSLSMKNNIITYKDSSQKTYVLYDPINNTEIKLSEYYKASYLNADKASDEKYLLSFVGADGKGYFSVIDSKGKEIVSPVECIKVTSGISYNFGSRAFLSQEGIVSYETDNGLCAMTTNGELLFENTSFNNLSHIYFKNGIARVNGNYINTKGEIILDSIVMN